MKIETVEMFFKNREKERRMWRGIFKEGPNSIRISADNEDNEIDLHFDTNCLKELALLINEFLFRGEDIDIIKRTGGDYTERGPVVRVGFDSVCLEDDNIAVCVEDSKDLEYNTFIFSITGKEKDRVGLVLRVDQARQIIKVLKQFVVSYDLNSRAHKGVKAIPATNPA